MRVTGVAFLKRSDAFLPRPSRRFPLITASIAAMILTTEALITDVPEEAGSGPAMPPGGGMGGMY